MKWAVPNLPKKSLLTIVAIAVVALLLSVAAFVTYSYAASNIASTSFQEVHNNARVQANDMSNIVSGELQNIGSNVGVIANSVAATSGYGNGVHSELVAAQNTTFRITTGYFWINSSGAILDGSNKTLVTQAQVEGANYSQRPYFLGAKQTNSAFITTDFTSPINNQTYVVVAAPIFSPIAQQPARFEGVIIATVGLITLGSYVQSQISKYSSDTVGMIDPTGIVLYSSDLSLIGTSVFSSNVQSLLPASLKVPYYAMINESLAGKTGFQEFHYRGTSGGFAFQPVTVQLGNRSIFFGALFVSAADVLATAQAFQIRLLGFVSLGTISGIVAGALIAILLFFRSNRLLSETVMLKTKELVSTNEKLITSNEQLAGANSKLEEQAKAQRDLINIAAHELRTPTQTILVNAELMKDALPQKKTIAQTIGSSASVANSQLTNELEPLVDSTYRNAKRLANLTNNILEVATIDNRTLKLRKEKFDLNSLIRESIEETRGAAIAGTATLAERIIEFKPQNPNLMVEADRTKIYQVVRNLLGNALHFTDKNSRIVVTTDTKDGNAIVSIKDSGKGIDPKIFPRLFGKFVTESGTGLGLYISKGYVEAHGGRVWAENNLDSRGATFSFSIPIEGSDNPKVIAPD